MADEPSETELAEARLIVATACAAAGKAENIPAWKGRVNTLIPEVGAMLGERSSQMKRALMMAEAVVFTAEFIGFEMSQASKRYEVKLVHAVDKDHPQGVQTIGTDRSDTGPGKAMLAHLEIVRPGNTLLCWKGFEKRAGRRYAVLMHFEVLPDRPKDADDTGPTPADRRQPGPGEDAARPSPGPNRSAASAAIDEWQRKLTPKQLASAVRRARQENIWPATEESLDRVLVLMSEESKK